MQVVMYKPEVLLGSVQHLNIFVVRKNTIVQLKKLLKEQRASKLRHNIFSE